MKFSFFQPIDQNGKPHAIPNGGIISLEVESSQESGLFLDWMISADLSKDGEIAFTDPENGGVMKVLKFEIGYCVAYDEEFDASGIYPMAIQLSISSKHLSCREAALNKAWEN